jgi:diguanylate cyclase (GGDEF)-like protein
MKQGAASARFFSVPYVAAAVAVIGWSLATLPQEAARDGFWFLLAALSLLRYEVRLGDRLSLPATVPIYGAGMLLLPVQAAVLIEVVIALLFSIRAGRSPERIIFNVANFAIPCFVSASLFRLFHPQWMDPVAMPLGLLVAALALLLRYAINLTAVHVYMTLQEGKRPFAGWWQTITLEGWHSVGIRSLGLMLMIAYPVAGPWSLLLAVWLLFCLQDAARLYAERDALARSAWVDGLTGVGNRAAWEKFVREARGKTLGAKLVVVVDLNGLKGLNDTAGHLEGDRAIRELAAALVESSGTRDQIFRYGGDEFVLILPGASLEDTRLERILRAVDRFGANWAAEKFPVSAALGFAASPIDGSTIDELFQTADQRMYRMKRSTLTPDGYRSTELT